MTAESRPYRIPFQLRSDIPRPDGPVPLRIDARRLLEAVGARGVLDVNTLRVADMNLFFGAWGSETIERTAATQFVPDPDYDPGGYPFGTLWFHLYKYPWEDKGFPRSFRLYFDTVRAGGSPPTQPTAEPRRPAVQMVEHVPGGVQWLRDGKTALAFNGPFGAKPGFHPVTTPAGRVLTVDRPRDHLWHHGLFVGWTSVQAPSTDLKPYAFWGEPGGGLIRTTEATAKHAGPVLSTFRTRSTWCTQSGQPVFHLDLLTRYQSIDVGWDWLDLEMTLSAIGGPVTLKTDYGHLKARMNLDLRDAVMLDSDGRETRDGPRQRGAVDWIGISGALDGAPVSLLLINDPANPGGRPSGDGEVSRRHFPMDEGMLFAWMGLNPVRDRAITLEPDRPLTWRYRAVTSDRRLTREFVDYQALNYVTPWCVDGLPAKMQEAAGERGHRT